MNFLSATESRKSSVLNAQQQRGKNPLSINCAFFSHDQHAEEKTEDAEQIDSSSTEIFSNLDRFKSVIQKSILGRESIEEDSESDYGSILENKSIIIEDDRTDSDTLIIKKSHSNLTDSTQHNVSKNSRWSKIEKGLCLVIILTVALNIAAFAIPLVGALIFGSLVSAIIISAVPSGLILILFFIRLYKTRNDEIEALTKNPNMFYIETD